MRQKLGMIAAQVRNRPVRIGSVAFHIRVPFRKVYMYASDEKKT